MPIASKTHVMPEGLEDFPWVDLLHMWGYPPFGRGLELRLWLTPSDPNLNPRDYWAEASATHLKIWEWLESRCAISELPELKMEGRAWVDRDGQRYERMAIRGTYYVGRAHSSSRT
jgi:hypothetical protein